MTGRDDFDRRLAAWLAADATSREPEHLLGSVLARTARTRRRPAWLIPERWIPMSAITSRTAAARRVPWRLIIAVALLILALAVGALLVAGSQQRRLPAPFGPAANGLVAYAADGDIYTVDPVTGQSRAIVTGPESDVDPVWSLDGAWLAFQRQQPGGDRLYVARSDGSDLTLLTLEPLTMIKGYGFSPDGRKVVFMHSDGLAIAGSDGSGVRLLDVGMLATQATFRPPDGGQILFIGGATYGDSGLYVINADGTGLHALVEFSSGRHIGEAQYSPDGSRIAYYYWDDAPVFTVRTHVMAADGTGDRLVDRQSEALWDGGVAWSNDGTRLAIVRGYSGSGYEDTRAAIVPVDRVAPGVETDPSVVVNDECCASFAWSPDDSSILWTATDASGRFVSQLLIDPDTGEASPVPWAGTSPPAWQRVAP